MKKLFKNKIFIAAVCLIVALCLIATVGAAYVLGVDAYTVLSTRERILTVEEAAELDNVDCIIVLGCKVQSDGSPSHMLNDRLEVGVDLFYGLSENGKGSKLLMSGDHGTEEYNEVF